MRLPGINAPVDRHTAVVWFSSGWVVVSGDGDDFELISIVCQSQRILNRQMNGVIRGILCVSL